jgi:hypothetical protein
MTDQEFFQKCDNLERRIKQLEAAVSKIEAESKPEFEPEFERVSHGEPYFYIYGNTMNVAVSSEDSDYISDTSYINNNYFYTKKRAQEVADKIKFLLKLERLHDIYCPYYEPDWNDSAEGKWCVYYSHNAKKWLCGKYSTILFPPQSSFPTEEIAQKVCDVLNNELE